MLDISDTILAKSNQLNADDLIGGELKIKITKVIKDETNKDQPILIEYAGFNGKPYKPSKSMRRCLAACWGRDASTYVGREIVLYRDPTVRWAGQEIGGIRISHASHINEDIVLFLQVSKGKREKFVVKPLVGTTKAEKKPEVKFDEFINDVHKAGFENAKLGIAAFTEWGKSLTPEDRASITSVIPTLTKIAKEADGKAQ